MCLANITGLVTLFNNVLSLSLLSALSTFLQHNAIELSTMKMERKAQPSYQKINKRKEREKRQKQNTVYHISFKFIKSYTFKYMPSLDI